MVVTNTLDAVLRLLVTLGLLGWNIVEGAVFENEYPKIFVALYPYPLWRIALLVALFVGASWCPSVGLMMAFGLVFYGMDMELTLEKWSK